MKVSFVVPTYKKKVEQFTKCVDSLLTQSHKDIEIIAVFDGPDQLLESYAEKYAKQDSRFRHIVIEHGGACKARNEGFRESTGDIVSFWDADCYAAPEMTMVWCRAFDRFPQCDFVYSGYKWTNPAAIPWEGMPFDPWLIKQFNSIGPAMFPTRRRAVVEWDEALEGLQDWDYWRRVVSNGSKGFWIRGHGFATDMPDESSISGKEGQRVNRINAIRNKYNDPVADILVCGKVYADEAMRIAKILGADYIQNPYYLVHDYKAILNVGFLPHEIEEIRALVPKEEEKTKRIVYWCGIDAEQVACGPHKSVKEWVKKVNDRIHVNLCSDYNAKKCLEDLGINAEEITMPMDEGQVATTLPEKFKVLVFADGHHLPFWTSIIKAMPDIDFDMVDDTKPFMLTDYSVVTQFCPESRLTDGTKKALLNGRYVISNVQAPYAGYIENTQDLAKYKEAVVRSLRELKGKTEINKEAQDYYLDLMSRAKFKEAIASYANELEAVR
jgi:hypothetical protein